MRLKEKSVNTDVIVVGGGLSGLTAALKLKSSGFNPIIVDDSISEAKGSLGGFTKFSGAKFSLPPAGMGLLEVAGSEEELWRHINETSEILGLDLTSTFESNNTEEKAPTLRQYKSILFSPSEIDSFINKLSKKLVKNNVETIKGKCTSIELDGDIAYARIETQSGGIEIASNSIFFAGGRLHSTILENAGIKKTNIKGIDVGIRIEFPKKIDLYNLRRLGPDAKILKGDCRTFCLNYPGEIFRYPFDGISIPGGIVAGQDSDRSNFGILCRCKNKTELIERITRNYRNLNKDNNPDQYNVSGSMLGEAKDVLSYLYGADVVSKLVDFSEYLKNEGLIDWSTPHIVHLPLIDWYWPTFSMRKSFKTSHKSVYCIGDSSGHARGLLQAAVSGHIAAEEFSLNE